MIIKVVKHTETPCQEPKLAYYDCDQVFVYSNEDEPEHKFEVHMEGRAGHRKFEVDRRRNEPMDIYLVDSSGKTLDTIWRVDKLGPRDNDVAKLGDAS